MTGRDEVIQEIAAALELVEQGFPFINDVEITVQLEVVKAPVEGIVHALELDTSIDIPVAETIADIGKDGDVFPGSITLVIIKGRMDPGPTELDRLNERN